MLSIDVIIALDNINVSNKYTRLTQNIDTIKVCNNFEYHKYINQIFIFLPQYKH